MSNILAGIGLAQLSELDKRVKIRRNIFNIYYENLSHIDGLNFMPEMEYGSATRWLTVLKIDSKITGLNRTVIINALAKIP